MKKNMKWMITALIIIITMIVLLVIGNEKIKEKFNAEIEHNYDCIEINLEKAEVEDNITSVNEGVNALTAFTSIYTAPYIMCGIYSVMIILSGFVALFVTSKLIEFEG